MVVTSALWAGGAERHLATVLPALDRDRFEPAVCCVQYEGDYFAPLARAGVRCVSLDCPDRRHAPRAFRRLVRVLRDFRPDVVLTFPLNADVVGRLAATATGVPVVAAWKHGCEHTREHPLDRWSERLLAPVTDYCLGVAAAQLPFLVDGLGVPPRKIRVVPNGIDLSGFTPRPGGARDAALAGELGVGPEAPVVGVVARFRPEKDHATFLRAARLVADRRPDVRFLLVGDGPLRADLERLAARLGVAGQVRFAGKRSDVPRVLGLVDVSVLSSANDCFPYAVLESMAMAVPVVATAVGAVPEIVDDGVTGHVVPPGDPAALARQMLALLDDPASARAMGRAGRLRVERRFTAERSVRGLEDVLLEMVAPRQNWPDG
jgi:glycosyltransferase involved in cell wall biosynthesis